MCLVLTLLVFSHALLLSPSAARTDVIDTGRSMAADGPLVLGAYLYSAPHDDGGARGPPGLS